MEVYNLTVNPGDEIYSNVFITDVDGNLNPNGGYANFYIGDLTTGQSTGSFSTPITPGLFSGSSAEWVMLGGGYLSDYWYAVMQDTYAETYDGNYATWQGGPSVNVSYQTTMYNASFTDILSTVYPLDSTTIEFIWSNFN
jgi:hypothetical protein